MNPFYDPIGHIRIIGIGLKTFIQLYRVFQVFDIQQTMSLLIFNLGFFPQFEFSVNMSLLCPNSFILYGYILPEND